LKAISCLEENISCLRYKDQVVDDVRKKIAVFSGNQNAAQEYTPLPIPCGRNALLFYFREWAYGT
jgi:hypothetical protein